MTEEQDQGASALPIGLSQAEPEEGLGPTGFDPSRITEIVAAIDAKVLAPFLRKAADELYCQMLETAEDYLRDNLDWNLRSHLEMLQRENKRMRTELYEVDRLLGSFGLSGDARMGALRELDRAKGELIALRYQIAFPSDSDGSRYGRDREDGLDGEDATARAEGIAQGKQP